jgi:trans-2,3-dihydro-3-hydroxyanthranilate isomerase
VGTAVTLARRGVIRTGDVVQECGAGLLPITVDTDKATLTGGLPTIGDELDPAPLLATAGLAADDLVGLPARSAGAGIPHTFLPVTDEAVARASLDPGAAREHGVKMVYVFAWDGERRQAHARLFGPGLGVPEDPATGSAALGLGIWLVASGLVPGDGQTSYRIEQGGEMGRPSVLECTVSAEAGQAVGTTVTGQVVPIASGTLSEG